MTTNLLGLDLDGLAAFCEGLGEKRFRATQLFRWIHQRGARDFEQMTDLAKSLRDKLPLSASISGLTLVSRHDSADGTVKWLFDVGNGDVIETVFIPETDRGTLCISSQAGCAVGCRFCSTGHQGFSRNLTTAEIVAQLWFAEHTMRQQLGQERRVISNVVMMGMGEPLQNYSQLLPALRVMLDDHGYGLSRRRVTVSTSGVVPMMDRLATDCPVALAVSLHAPEDGLRSNLVPLNRKYPISELMDACARYQLSAPRDFITFEYCMLDGVNDQPEHARELVKLMQVHAERGLSGKLNLIPFNPFPASGLTRSPMPQVQAFAQILMAAGIVTTIRKTRGDDIDAACGQLAGDVQDRTDAKVRMASQRQGMLGGIKVVCGQGSGRMKFFGKIAWVSACWVTVLLTGCAGHPNGANTSSGKSDIVTESDEPEVRRRARLRLELASNYFEQGQTSVALDELKQALVVDPGFADAYNLRGLVYMRLNDVPLAEESFRRALALSPRDPDVAHNFGWFLCQQGRYRESSQLFAQALANPQYAGQAKSLMAQGVCQIRAGQRAEAEQSFMRSYEIDAGNPLTGYNLANLLYERGDVVRSQFYIRRLNNSAFANAETLWLGVKVEQRLNNRDAARQLGEQLKKRYGDSREAGAYERGAFNE